MARCANCGAENPDDAAFCGSCGAGLRGGADLPVGQAAVPVIPPQTGSAAGPTVPPPPLHVPPPPPPGQLASPYLPPGSGDRWSPATTGDGPSPLPPPSAYPPPPGYIPPPPIDGGPGGPPHYGAYGPAPVFDANTSGMGAGYPLPPETQGWTFAGCIPFGLFGFFNGAMLWGLLGLLGGFIPYLGAISGLVYLIYMGMKGRELAWQGRRFDSVEHFNAVMGAWNTWGIVILVLDVVCIPLMVIFWVAMFSAMGSSSGHPPAWWPH